VKTISIEKEKKLSNKRKIKNYLVNKHDQLRIALITLVYMSIIFLITMTVVFYPSMSDIFNSQDLNVQYRASLRFLLLLNRLVFPILILFVLVLVHQIVITHRIWGPLKNFTNTIKKVGTGDFTRKAITRKRDFLKEECKQVNNMVAELTQLVLRIRTNHLKLMSALDDITMPIEDRHQRKIIEDRLDEVRRKAEMLAEDISHFKLENDSKESHSSNQAQNQPKNP
jgi:methyl-accepting chemotaxis protein